MRFIVARVICRVGTYEKLMADANRHETKYNLSCPGEIEIIGRAVKR
jgi:hypothetical protein